MTVKAKRFRIAVEGATTDGRAISREWISQMATNYNPTMFGARINMEHLKGYTPDSPFRRYGDVTALTAEEITEGPLQGKMALYGDINPTPDLVQLSKARQKIYTSIEVNPKFADTNEAYLVGLAITDDPASLGTEMLAFSATATLNPLASRKTHPDNLFTAAIEAELVFEEVSDPGVSLLSRIMAKFANKQTTDDERLADVHAAVEEVAGFVQLETEQVRTQIAAVESSFNAQLADVVLAAEADRAELVELNRKLSTRDSFTQARRPQSSGGNGKSEVLTDC